MKKTNNDDWRLSGYNGHLDGKVFVFKKFFPSKKNDHEHCEFCWKKISNLQNLEEDCVSGGYCILIRKQDKLIGFVKNVLKILKVNLILR